MASYKIVVLSFVFACIWALSTAQEEDGPVITTPLGEILGTIRNSTEGREFFSFLGIPFAEPPVDELRFAAPVKSGPWEGRLNATKEGKACYQIVTLGQEDCLYLDVHTPKLPSPDSDLLPVYVYIYGGAFILGSETPLCYGPERYLNHDMVVVFMNYRLGPFGFLSTYDAAAPGNFGLLDQHLALEWVRDNIASFGGNPNDVTLGGESAGSDSTSFHVLSPKSAGLFHQAILESGSALTPWGVIENPRYYANRLAEQVNCTTDDSYEMLACLREVPPHHIFEKSLAITVEELVLAFVPVVENPDDGPLFLWEDPLTLLQEGRFNKVPLIAGFNRDEGCLIYSVAEPVGLFRNVSSDYFFDVNLPLLIRILTDYRENLINISYAIKDFYYSKIDLDDEHAVTRTNIDVCSDMFMIPWVFKFSNIAASHGVPVYNYALNYVGEHSFTNFTGEPDISHGEDLIYLFNVFDVLQFMELNEADSAFSADFVQMFANFIISGNPTPDGLPNRWPTTPFNSTQHISLDGASFPILPEYATDRMDFWLYQVPKIASGVATV
ncbi:hypothetical protein CHUAL_002481 [Chamberlinius hualienensis]